MKKLKTNRGFAFYKFTDLYGVECTIQKSSLAADDAIWIGVDNANPQIMASQAKSLGVNTKEINGWIPYPLPDEVLMTTRMHLNRKQIKELLPILQKFVDTGKI